MDGVINGDLVAVGDEVTINGTVDGSLVAAGKKVILNGPVTGNAVISALTMVLGPQASVGRDVYFAGASLETADASTVNRDLNVVSLESNLTGTVNRDVNALVGPLQLIQVIRDYMENRGWIPNSTFFVNPDWAYQSQLHSILISRDRLERQAASGLAFGLPALSNLRLASSFLEDEAALNAGPEFRAPFQASTIDVERLRSWAVPFLRNLGALLILGLLAVWLAPMQLIASREQARQHPWRALGTGLVVFFFGWILVLLVFLLVLALAIFLLWISLPNLGFLTGTIGLSALGLAVSVFWLSIVFFSKLVVAAMIGSMLFKRFFPKYAQSRVWPFVVGAVIYALLASIPYLGWLIMVISTFLGLGALWMVAFQHSQPQDTSMPGLAPAGENLDMSLVSEG
jgi:hypothetical protein